MSLFKSAFTVGSFTLFSRIFGYIRDIFIASFLGTGFLADAFLVAFRLPNFFRTLSAEGAFNAAFIPLFSKKLSSEGKKQAMNFAEHVMAFMFFVLLMITILMQIFMPYVMTVLAPGYIDDPEKFNMTVTFARITFPYLIFISLISLVSGILNSIGKFAYAASAPILLNIVMILSLTVFAAFTDTPAHALSWGVAVAGFIQLLWVLYAACKSDVLPKLCFPRIDKHVTALLKKMLPGIIGSGVTQINLWINTVIATTISGAVSYLYYADRLVQFPLAIIGTAMGTALLPSLSKTIESGNKTESIQIQNKALEIVLLFTIPAAFALMIIALPLISVMFERGAFEHDSTIATASALIAYSIGLPAFVMVKIFSPVFFAHLDTKTPVKIAAICLVASVSTSLILIQHIGHTGLAVATSAAAWLNCFLLCFILIKRGYYEFSSNLIAKVIKIVAAAIFMVLALVVIKNFVATYLAGQLFYKIIALAVLIIGGIITFFAVIFITKSYSLSEIRKLIK